MQEVHFDINKNSIFEKYLIFLTGSLLLEGSSKMGLWGTTLHMDTIFFNEFVGQKESKTAKKSILIKKPCQPL